MIRIAGLLLVAASLIACERSAAPASDPPAEHDRLERAPNGERGRTLFVEKGCVLCHAVNGVGGKAAPALDAATEMDAVDPVGFAARMWRGAPAMIELQNLELGYVIWLEAQDLVDLAAFAADSHEQKRLTEADVPEPMRGLILDERYWETEDWGEFLGEGQEGFGEPEVPPAEETDTD